MSRVRDLRLPGCLERLSPIFGDGLQHHETRLFCFLLGLPQQTFVDEGGHSIQHRDGRRLGVHSSTDRLDGLEGAATDKDGEPPEEPLLIGVEQLIAPLDGPAQRLLPRWCVAYTTRQHRQSPAQPSEQRWWRQQFDAGGGQFNGQRQAIQAGTEFRAPGGSGIPHRETRLEPLSPPQTLPPPPLTPHPPQPRSSLTIRTPTPW